MADREQMIEALVQRSDRWQRRAMEADTPTPDPPAVGRDELARWFATRHRERAVEDVDYAEADALLSSGVLVDAADVRARALEDAADWVEDSGYVGWDVIPRLLRGRVVSERDRGTT